MNVESIVIVFYITLYAIALARYKHALFLYIFFLPIRSLIDTTILGIISYNVVFGFIFLFHALKLGLFKNIGFRSIQPIKSLTVFSIIFFLAISAIAIKERYLLHDYLDLSFNAGWLINRMIIFIVSVINFIIIIKFSLQQKSNRVVAYNAIVASAIVIVFSVYFANWFDSIGINIRETLDDDVASYNYVLRFSGLYNWGDVNSLSTFLNLVIAFVITKLSLIRKTLNFVSLTILIILVSGVIYTMSRMGFITLVVILVYFVIFLNTKVNRFSFRTVANLTVIGLALFITYLVVDYFGRLDPILARLMEQGVTGEVGVTGHRFFRWISFIEFTLSSLDKTFLGSSETFYVIRYGIWTDPHNFFVSLFYFNGIILVILFIRSYVKLFFSVRKINLSIYFNLYTIIILISLMIISQAGFISVLILFVGLIIHESRAHSGLPINSIRQF